MIAREEHYAVTPNSEVVIRISYTDGFGRVAMDKIRAANDPVTSDPRWIGSGKTVYNNKGNIVLQYEPYFSETAAYDPAAQAAAAGVSARYFYDALGRNYRTELPDGSFSKTLWTSWKQEIFDGNDTVLDSQWYEDRLTGPLSSIPQEVDARQKTEHHANTPTVLHLDNLGRPFYTIQQNKYLSGGSWVAANYATLEQLDITGNRLSIKDARGLTTLQHWYGYLNIQGRTESVDSGRQLMLADASGQPLYGWDANDNRIHQQYDLLRRPSQRIYTTANGSTTKVLEQWTYGEGQASDKNLNLRGQVFRIHDGAGRVVMNSYDFKGLPLSSTEPIPPTSSFIPTGAAP